MKMTKVSLNSATTKMLGDAGEHYALSQFSFIGKPAAKMPDNWTAYDLAVEENNRLARVSVKTRSESSGWSSSKWFTFDDRKQCDWLVFIFRGKDECLRSWIIPFELALNNANTPGPNRKDAWQREIGWGKLTKGALSQYENNWEMKHF
jgi:hypothetical protein